VLDVRQLFRRSVLAPGHGPVTVEHQCGVRDTFVDQPCALATP
jgi:hypothetical protein